MYSLEVIGFKNFKRIQCNTIEDARKVWKQLSTEKYTVAGTSQLDKPIQCNWSMWELYEGGAGNEANSSLVAKGKF